MAPPSDSIEERYGRLRVVGWLDGWKGCHNKETPDASLLTPLFHANKELLLSSPTILQSHNSEIPQLTPFASFSSAQTQPSSLSPACGLGRHGECLFYTLDSSACICSRCPISGTNNGLDRHQYSRGPHLGPDPDRAPNLSLDRVHGHYARPGDGSDDNGTVRHYGN